MTAETALQQSIFENSVIIGEDTDLLCHWIAYLNEHKISFTFETKANSKERARTWHSICCLQLGYSTAEFTGYPCVTLVMQMSCILGIGKGTTFTKVWTCKSQRNYKVTFEVFWYYVIMGEGLNIWLWGRREGVVPRMRLSRTRLLKKVS